MTNFESDFHALIAWMVRGVALNHGIDLVPVVDDDGNYTNRFELIDSGLSPLVHVFISVEPPVFKVSETEGKE